MALLIDATIEAVQKSVKGSGKLRLSIISIIIDLTKCFKRRLLHFSREKFVLYEVQYSHIISRWYPKGFSHTKKGELYLKHVNCDTCLVMMELLIYFSVVLYPLWLNFCVMCSIDCPQIF